MTTALEEPPVDNAATVEQEQQRQAEVASRVRLQYKGVSVTVSGLGDLVGVRIRPGTVDGDSDDDLGDLGDMIVAAYLDDILRRALAGDTDWSAMSPYTWKLTHPESLRAYRQDERRQASDRKRQRRAHRRRLLRK